LRVTRSVVSKASPNPARCPVCKAASADAYRPFCSRRCADIDLGRWFSGGYAIGGGEDEIDAQAPPREPSRGDDKNDN